MTDPIAIDAIRRRRSPLSDEQRDALCDEVDRLRAENEALYLVNGAADELIQAYKVMLDSCDEVDRLRAEVDALAAALADIADGDCLEKPDICPPDDRCDVCAARHALYPDTYDHAGMARRIRRWLPPVGGATVGTLAATVEVDHRTMSSILAAAEVNDGEADRLRAENTALADALEDTAIYAECAGGSHICHIAWPDDPESWCPVCVSRVTWCAWKMGALT